MTAGYWFGQVLKLPAARRDRICLLLGAVAIAAFLVLRGWNIYGDPRHWGAPGSKMPPMLAFLATTKYPASLLFLLMTLGPLFVLTPLAERLRGFGANALSVVGRVLLSYHPLHTPLLRLPAIIVSLVR